MNMSYSVRSSISGFMQWAERRLAEEVERNEQLAKDAGTAVCFVEHKRLPYNLSDTQRLEIVKRVDQLRNEGMGNIESCKKVGLHITTYCKFRRKLGLGKYKKQKNV